MGLDLAIHENGNGGDLVLGTSDLLTVLSIENQCYLAWFGGNKKQSTIIGRNTAQSFDYWANDLLMRGFPSQQFNSLTEAKLDKVTVTSEGRIELETAMKKDIEFLSEDFGAQLSVDVSIESDDRFKAKVIIVVPGEDEKIIIVGFRKSATGDFWIVDFNDDFFV